MYNVNVVYSNERDISYGLEISHDYLWAFQISVKW